jgi:anti-sigma B factor antagonist
MSDSETGSELINNVRDQGDALIATLHGEVDLHNSPDLRGNLLRLLETKKPKRLVLNLADVPYMDSSAIAVLVETLQRVRKHGGSVYLTNLQPRVKGLLEIARLETIFVVAADEADALKR